MMKFTQKDCSKEIVKVVPNNNNDLFVADIVDMENGDYEIYLMHIVGFVCAVLVSEDSIPENAYSYPILSDQLTYNDETYYLYDKRTDRWWAPYIESGKGLESLKERLINRSSRK